MVASTRRPAVQPSQLVTYAPRGESVRLLESQADEVLLEGPVGTGKSFALIWKAHLLALHVPGIRVIFIRKTAVSLTASAVATYKNKVLTTADYGVKFHGGSQDEPAAYRYRNGSRIYLGGLDDPGKIMSREYDLACVFEATELTLTDLEQLTTRMRNGVLPYQQVVLDCNPSVPNHWLNQRALAGTTQRYLSRHHDNPVLWDDTRGEWTPFGRDYMARLDKLTGVRRLRLLEGKWAAAEGQVYEGWDPFIHLVDRFDVPASWPRVWTIDFGFVHPFVWQWWAIDPDGTLWLYREIYMTHRLVEDHAAHGLRLSEDEPRPSVIVTDHDAEDRATFERKTGYRTTPATKNVSAGIQAVAERLRPQANGRPRLRIVRDALVERDQTLAEAGQPTSTADEFPSYVWNLAAGRRRGEEPVKEGDHGMDGVRYTVAHFDVRKGRGMLTA